MLKLAKITKSLNSKTVLNSVSLEIKEGEFFCVLGPSGCGKTTLLKIIAGLVSANSGDLYLEGTRLTEVPAQKREMAFVFQNYALFPHLSVFENVAFPLVAWDYSRESNPFRKASLLFGSLDKKLSPEAVHEVYAALSLVRLENFANRRIQTLSGGEAQRVALARALVIKPKVVLMDEPLANLDRELKIELRWELKRIHREVGLTFIYVTHDQEEALMLADRVALMREGRLETWESPQDLVKSPRDSWTAKFLGVDNIWPSRALSSAKIFVDSSWIGLWARDLKILLEPSVQTANLKAKFIEATLSAPNVFKAKLEFLAGGEKFYAWSQIADSDMEKLKPRPGQELGLSFNLNQFFKWES